MSPGMEASFDPYELYIESICTRCKGARSNFCAGCGRDVRSFWRKLWQRLIGMKIQKYENYKLLLSVGERVIDDGSGNPDSGDEESESCS